MAHWSTTMRNNTFRGNWNVCEFVSYQRLILYNFWSILFFSVVDWQIEFKKKKWVKLIIKITENSSQCQILKKNKRFYHRWTKVVLSFFFQISYNLSQYHEFSFFSHDIMRVLNIFLERYSIWKKQHFAIFVIFTLVIFWGNRSMKF